MYTADEKKNAIQKYIDNNYNATKTVRELGYPSVPGLLKWYNAYYPPKSEKTVKPKKERRVYTPEEKQHAIDLYFKNGCNLKKTVRELGYGSQTGVLEKKGMERKKEYIKIFPTEQKYISRENIELKKFCDDLSKVKDTNMNEFIEFCLSS